jgi:hypothetical protein
MSSPQLRLFLLSAAAQCAATAIFIASAWGYWRLFNKEAWPIMAPALISALAVESFILTFALKSRSNASKPFLKIVGATIASWFSGVVCFLGLDGIAKALYFQTPKIAWLTALLVVFLLMRPLNTAWTINEPI